MRIVLTVAAAVLVAQSAAVPAGAEPLSRTEREAARLLRQIESPRVPATPATTVSRSAAIRVVGIIHRVSPFTLPLFCTVDFGAFNGNLFIFNQEEMTKPVVFVGDTGTCDVTVPFSWQFAEATEPVELDVEISTQAPGDQGPVSAPVANPATDHERTSRFDFTRFALPAQGTTRTLGFEIDM